MSYILDALKKADRERDLGEVPDLETAHWGVRRHARPQPWMWIAGALLALNGLWIAIVLLDRDGNDVPSGTEITRTETVAPAPGSVVPVPRTAREAVLPATTRPRVPVRPPVQQAAKAPSSVPSPVQTPVTTRTSQSPQTPTGEFDFPEWRELSLELRSGFKLPRIDVHVYAEDPARRFIMADLKKYREGETLANGAVLEKIHPGSIQLNYQGTRFRVDR
ncbi:MAG: general secretion pathway protein GspB [Gammaproteobacteria bacterium]